MGFWLRAWFLLKTLPERARFLLGKASFVEADIRITTNSVSEGPEARLLAHFRLDTRKPRSGAQGWALFLERVGEPGPHMTVSLDCGWCGHRYFVQVLSAIDPLAFEGTGGRPPGRPASYDGGWFRFSEPGEAGEPRLSCPRCEQSGRAGLRILGRARR